MSYLDNAATTPLSSEMVEYLSSMLNIYGNPSSTHSEGVKAKKLIENVREKTASFINAVSSDDIYFTSSGSASNALGIYGFATCKKCDILYSPTVHKSILETVRSLGKFHNISSSELKIDCFGNIDINYLKHSLQTGCNTKLVVVDYANSEIGTVQNIKEIAEVVHLYGECNDSKLFVDCTGSISTIPLNVDILNIDMASFSAHKIGALKGVGVFYKKEDIEIAPLICGSQERGLFAGTENLLGILSLGKAIDLIKYNKTSHNRDFVWSNLERINGVSLVGSSLTENRLSNNLYICIKGISGYSITTMMDDVYKTQISTGSACNSGVLSPSPLLLKMGLNEDDANSCIRISFSGDESMEELSDFCKNLNICIEMLR